MILGAIYVVWFATDFLGPFQGFLITLGVPLSAWCGIFLADLLLRRGDYDADKLFDASAPHGYGTVDLASVATMVVSTVIGWGLVTNTYAGWLDWQGYLLGPIGGKDGEWAFANVGVLVALVLGFAASYAARRGTVARQESAPHQPG
jgi:nucleobase:cation symporter-1, NCS1 family